MIAEMAAWPFYRPDKTSPESSSILPDRAAFTREGNSFGRATGYEHKQLKPPIRAFAGWRAELSAAIRTHEWPTDSSDET